MKTEDVQAYVHFCCFDPDVFQELLTRIVPRITRRHTSFRPSLSPGLKLAIILRQLASGDSYKSLMYSCMTLPSGMTDYQTPLGHT